MARRTAYDQAAYVEASMFYARNQGISHHMVCKNPNRSLYPRIRIFIGATKSDPTQSESQKYLPQPAGRSRAGSPGTLGAGTYKLGAEL